MAQYQLPSGGYLNSTSNGFELQLPDGGYLNEASAAGGDVSIAVAQGTIVLSGLVPSANVSASSTVITGVGTIVISGFAPSLVHGFVVPGFAGSITTSGLAPSTLATDLHFVLLPVGRLTLQGRAPVMTATVAAYAAFNDWIKRDG